MGLNYHPHPRDWIKLIGPGNEYVVYPRYYVPAGKQLVITAIGMTVHCVGPHHSLGTEQLCIPGTFIVIAYPGTPDDTNGDIGAEMRWGYAGQADAAVLQSNGGQFFHSVTSMFPAPPGMVYHAGTQILPVTAFDDADGATTGWTTGYARAYGYLAPDT